MPRVIKLKEASKISRLLAEGKSVRKVAEIVKRSPNAVQAVKTNYPELVDNAKEKYKIKIVEELQPSIDTVVELRDGAKNEGVRLQSAKTLIDEAKDIVNPAMTNKISMVFNITDKPKIIREVIQSEEAE